MPAAGLGVTESAWPFQVSTRGVAVPERAAPTSTQKDAPAHDTEVNLLPTSPGPAAVTSDHVPPFHSSTSGLGPVIGPCCPAARQKEGLTHETELNWLGTPVIVTPGCVVVQLEPSQISFSVPGLNPAMVIVPTATQNVALTHETPRNCELWVPIGNEAGVATDQADPFHVSMSASPFTSPTATRRRTARRTRLR